MNSATLKIVAIIVALVVVVSAVAFFLIKPQDEYDMNGFLPVMGNADEDYNIDNKDVEVIEKIIAGDDGYTLAKYPYADADNNGTVDSDDVDLVKKIMKGESCTVFHGTDNWENGFNMTDSSWPIKYATTSAYATSAMIMKVAGVIEDHIVGIYCVETGQVDGVLYPTLKNMETLGTGIQYDIELLSECKSKTGLTASFAGDTQKSEAEMEAMGIDVIYVDSGTPEFDHYISLVLLIGFLFNEPTQAEKIADWSEKLYAEMDEKLSTLTDSERITVILNDWDDGELVPKKNWRTGYVLRAGALYPDELTGWMMPGDWIYDVDFDKFFVLRKTITGDSYFSNQVNYKDYFGGIYNFYSLTEPCINDEVYVICFDLPLPVLVAYMSNTLYPDLFGEDWANEKFQEFIDLFWKEEIDVSEHDFVLDYVDYKDKMNA